MMRDSEYTQRFHASHEFEATDHLRAARARVDEAASELREAVAAARVLKVTWSDIADILGVKKQTAQERFGGGAKDEVIRAWDAIERELWLLASLHGTPGRPLETLRRLADDGEVDPESAEKAFHLFSARAKAVHDSTFVLTEEEADRLIDVAVQLRPTLLLLRNSLVKPIVR